MLFAGTNEVRENYDDPTTENIEVQQSYLQTFINAVRATGGNNASRILVVQTYNTNVWHGLNYFTLPNDSIEDRLMVEIHHYDPYDFTLNGDGSCLYWGANFAVESACSWAQESYVKSTFVKVKAKWPDNGVPVIMGEYGAMHRSSYNGSNLTEEQKTEHKQARSDWLKYNTSQAIANGIVAVYWDNGYTTGNNYDFGIFNRATGAIADEGGVNALLIGAGLKEEEVSGSDKKSDSEFVIYPNPFETVIKLSFENKLFLESATIFDQYGRRIESFSEDEIISGIEIGDNYKSGVYILQIYSEGIIENYRVIKI